MTLPNLVGCGADKSGTTPLYHYLNQHPDIFMAKEKQTHFFSRHFQEDVSWYASKFEGHGEEKVIGEFSTSYMLDPAVTQRITEVLPGARLLFIFRDPIERAYSNYWFSISIGTEHRRVTFSKAIRSRQGFEKYVDSEFFDTHLQRFLEFHDEKDIHVIITEELKSDPLVQMSQCYRFLGVDPLFRPDVDRSCNATVASTSTWKVSLFRSWTDAKKRLKPLLRWLPHGIRRQ